MIRGSLRCVRSSPVELVGDATGGVGDNLLVIGDGADAMRTLVRLPAPSATTGKVKLVYIDPPFNTKQTFTHYDDGIEHSLWLSMIRDRLVLIRELLAPDGSSWVHLDDNEVAYCRVLMDEVFGRSKFVRRSPGELLRAKRRCGDLAIPQHDSRLCAARSHRWRHVRNLLPRGSDSNYSNPDDDPQAGSSGGSDPSSAGGAARGLMYQIATPAGRNCPAEGEPLADDRA